MLPPMSVFPHLAAAALGIAAALLGAGATAQAPVEDKGSLDERITRLERLLDSRGLLQMLDSVEALRKEVRDLRGEIELQTHSVGQIRQRQRELYLDLDGRMQRLEGGGAVAAAPAAGTAAPAVPAAAPSSAAPSTPAPPAPTATAPATAPAGQPPVQPAPAPAVAAVAPQPAPATQPAAPGAATVEIDPVKEQQAYQDAFKLVKEARFEQATEAFQAFLAQYPGGEYEDNAQYWLADAHYRMQQYDPAMEGFQRLLRDHPKSNKASGALLKVGLINAKLGNKAEAERVFNEIIDHYPQTGVARLARRGLQDLRN